MSVDGSGVTARDDGDADGPSRSDSDTFLTVGSELRFVRPVSATHRHAATPTAM